MLRCEYPRGQLPHAVEAMPLPLVSCVIRTTTGTGTSVPTSNGVVRPSNDTTSTESEFGAARLRLSVPEVPVTSVPVPTKDGIPALPARPEPRSVHGPAVGTQ